MQNWLKSTLAVGLIGLSTVACAQTPQPAAAPAAPVAPREAAAAASMDDEIRAEVDSATKRAVEYNVRAEVVRAQADDARRQAVKAITIAFPGGKKEKVAFLGVVTTRVTAALRENLNLQRGVGLVVETVEKDSPAEKAGLMRYDILQKMDDQLLIFAEQLGVLARLHKPGDEVTLTVLRKGQPQQIKVTLAEKEMMVDDEGMPKTFWPQGEMRLTVPETPELAGLHDKLMTIRNRVGNSSANYIFQDGQTTLEITRKNDSKHLKATDKDGKVLFDGAIDSDDQRKKIPEDVAKKLSKLEERMKSLPDSDDMDVKVRVLEP